MKFGIRIADLLEDMIFVELEGISFVEIMDIVQRYLPYIRGENIEIWVSNAENKVGYMRKMRRKRKTKRFNICLNSWALAKENIECHENLSLQEVYNKFKQYLNKMRNDKDLWIEIWKWGDPDD